jgi:hypothetical protein
MKHLSRRFFAQFDYGEFIDAPRRLDIHRYEPMIFDILPNNFERIEEIINATSNTYKIIVHSAILLLT